MSKDLTPEVILEALRLAAERRIGQPYRMILSEKTIVYLVGPDYNEEALNEKGIYINKEIE